MERIFEDDGAVLIKTYCFESGLWYLAESLGKYLESQGHKVYYVSKSKYQMLNASFSRTYLDPQNPEDFQDHNILKMTAEQSINEQLYKYIVKYGIRYLISFETLMEKANWIIPLKNRFRKELKIIDVPMAEWVSEKFLYSGSYKIFDEIWSLNNLTYSLFKHEKNLRDVQWPFVDSKLFNKRWRKKNTDIVNFLHITSTNPNYSTKNTEMVVKTFSDFLTFQQPDARLIIQGNLPENLLRTIEKHSNISNIGGVLRREELAKLYKQTDCILAPSSREGLSLTLYEGLASGCKVITTDYAPMNYISTPYLCKVIRTKKDKSLIPIAIIEEKSLYDNIKRVYEELKND